MDNFNIHAFAEQLVDTAHRAGQAIMGIYTEDFPVDFKSDASPVTQADKLAEALILADLAKLMPDIPVIAEEAASAGLIPEVNERFFLVDPLDGTREFVSKNGEFTVNIALVEHRKPVFGIIYAPAISTLYVTLEPDQVIRAPLEATQQYNGLGSLDQTILQQSRPSKDPLNIIASRSHMNTETRSYLEKLHVASIVNTGSSLKFCRLAEGSADLYPRFAPTMEWDTAAGHAILQSTGGGVETIDGSPLGYGKTDAGYFNPDFVAYRSK